MPHSPLGGVRPSVHQSIVRALARSVSQSDHPGQVRNNRFDRRLCRGELIGLRPPQGIPKICRRLSKVNKGGEMEKFSSD